MNSSTPVNYSSLVGIFIVLSIFTQGQTIINEGIVSGTWTESGSPYHIMNDIVVQPGNTLTIEPGVTVKIFSNLSFKVYGNLQVIGTSSDQISFIPIASNWKGLQLLNAEDTCRIYYCNFTNFINKTAVSGYWVMGGVLYANNSHILINHTNFLNNKIELETNNRGAGGAVSFENSIVSISFCSFFNNKVISVNDYYYLYGYGGALYSSGGQIILDDNIFEQNLIHLSEGGELSQSLGGGIYIEGGNISIENNVFQNNSCYAYAFNGDDKMFVSAEAMCMGGGIFCSSTTSFVRNNLIMDNICNSEADAWGLGMPWAVSAGGGIAGGIYMPSVYLENNTILFNEVSSDMEEGAGCYSIESISNCIIFNNAGTDQISNSITTYSCVQGGYPGQGNISNVPLFIAGPQGNYYLEQNPCQIEQSPCVDAGNPYSGSIIGTTRTDEIPDTGIGDMGFHYTTEINYPTIIAGFNSNNYIGQVPFKVQFEDNSFAYLLEITQWQWDFQNDGIIDSDEENPLFVYEETGNYSVKLIVTGEDTVNIITDTIVVDNYIHACNLQCGFTQDTNFGEYPLSVEFIDTSQIVNNAISTWKWDFQNDGIIDSYEQFPAWTYSWPGTYSVKLIIIDTSGYIFDTVINENLIDVFGIVAGFIAEPTQGIFPLTITFTDTSYSYLANQTQWKWDFQNDNVIDSWDQNPIWIYEEPGIYSVKLTATDTVLGVYDSILKDNLIIVCDLSPEFYAEPLFGYNPLEVQFYDTSQFINTEIGIWEWDFEHDGIIDSWGQHPVWVFEEPDLYSVKLRITDTSGQIWDSCIKEDYIEILTVGLYENLSVNNSDPLLVYPNPFGDQLTIEFMSPISDLVNIKLLNNSFIKITEIFTKEPVKSGNNIWTRNMNKNLETGLYYLVLTTKNNKQTVKKIIKIK